MRNCEDKMEIRILGVGIKPAAERVRAREPRLMDLTRSLDFSVEQLKRRFIE